MVTVQTASLAALSINGYISIFFTINIGPSSRSGLELGSDPGVLFAKLRLFSIVLFHCQLSVFPNLAQLANTSILLDKFSSFDTFREFCRSVALSL